MSRTRSRNLVRASSTNLYRHTRTLDSMVVNIVFEKSVRSLSLSLSLSMRALDEFSVFVSRNEIREIPREWLVERGEKKKLINFYDNPPTVLWTMSLFIPRTVDTWQFHWIFFTWNLQFRPKREKESERKFRIIEKQLFSIDYAIFTVKGLNNDTLGETRRGGKFLCPFKPVD